VADAAAKAEQVLNGGTTLSGGAAAAGIELARLRELSLLTAKPFVYVFNVDAEFLGDGELADNALRDRLAQAGRPGRVGVPRRQGRGRARRPTAGRGRGVAGRARLGEPGLNQLARAGFAALGLTTFLTAGPKEARAWTIKEGATAPEAAGVIHTDFQRGFIKAEVVSFEDLMAAGSIAAAAPPGRPGSRARTT